VQCGPAEPFFPRLCWIDRGDKKSQRSPLRNPPLLGKETKDMTQIRDLPKAPQPPLSHPGARPESDRAKRPPFAEPPATDQELSPGDRVEGLGMMTVVGDYISRRSRRSSPQQGWPICQVLRPNPQVSVTCFERTRARHTRRNNAVGRTRLLVRVTAPVSGWPRSTRLFRTAPRRLRSAPWPVHPRT
jgi:hypothetical protein